MKPNKGKKTLMMGARPGVLSSASPSVLGEISFDAVMTFDSWWRITYWNAAAEHMYGWTMEDVLGKTAEELFWSAETPQEVAEQNDRQARIDRGEMIHGEYRPCRKDGSYLWVEFTARAIFDKTGGIDGYVAVHRDRTERRRMEDDIKLIAKLPSENPNPVMRMSRDGQLVYANDASKPLLNFWAQEKGQNSSDEVQKQIREVFESDSKKVIEIEYNGKVLSCTLVPIRDMGYVNFYGSDITERRQISRQLRQSYAELQDQMNEMKTLLEILPIGVWTGNEDCSVITGNPAAYRIMGFDHGINASLTSPDPQTPSDLRVFVEGKEVSPENAPMQLVARTGKPLHNLEHEILFADGTRKTVLANIIPLFDEHGDVRKVIGAYADITDRTLSAERLGQLQQVTAALSEAVTPSQIARIIIKQGVPALGAAAGTVLSLSEDLSTLKILYSSLPEEVAQPYQEFPVSRLVPSTAAIRFNLPVWIKSRREYLERYPHLQEQIDAWKFEVAVAIPLIVNERPLGVLTLSFDGAREFTSEDQSFILTLAQQAAQALERAQLYQTAQRALSELQLTYDQSPIGMIQLDNNLRYRRVNETLARMNGIPIAEHIGKTINEIVPDMTPKLEEGLRRVMETGQPEYDIEIVGETQADPGIPHTWLEVWYPWRNESGDVIGVNIAVQDITNRKRAEDALRQSEKRFSSFMQHLPGLAWIKDIQGRYIYANSAAQKAFNTPQERLYGSTDEDIFPKEVAAKFRQNDEKALLDDTGVQVIEELRQNDGVLHYSLVSKFPIPGPDGNPILIGGIAFDITQRRHAEEALRESGKRFAGVVNSAMDAIISVDSEQRVILFIPAAEKMFGCTVSQVIGQPLEQFIPSRHRELHKEHIFRFGLTGETGRAMGHLKILSALRHDGTEFPIEASISHIETGGQHLYTVILRDVTERKRVEDALLESQMELQILNDTLEQKVQAQTAEIRDLASKLTKAEQRERNRVARILHDDLQQRLYAIQIQVSSLSDRYGKEGDKEQQDFARIKDQLQAAVLLTRNLSIDLSPPILHDEGLTQAVEWLASQMKKQYGLQVELQADESYANPDEDLRVLVFNCIRELLFNIVKHAGGDRAYVVLQRANADLRIEVRDEGKGFNIAELPWQTLNVPEESGSQPQSFGLPTIYHQLSLFGGQMDVQSKPGEGTIVTITIPYP